MKYDPNESYETWVNRVRLFEHGFAMQRIAKGEPLEQVLEDMGRRMMEKMLHPVIKALMPAPPSMDEILKSRKKYEETMKTIGPRADHVVDEKIDKSE